MKSIKSPNQLLDDLRGLIENARHVTARAVNSSLVLLYWQIGRRICKEVLKNKRAEYGEEIVPTLSAQLVAEFGNGFSEANLWNMIRFAEVFPDKQILYTLCRELNWSHFRAIIYIKDPLQRDFYAEMCRIERWSVRSLRKKINSMLYERTALSKKPDQLAKKELQTLREGDKLSPDLIFRDPYFLDFLGLKDTYSEKDFESAILREMENFILELGVGFTFVARQKRITIGSDDFYIDLLFYHRKLQRLVAVELKLGKFQSSHKGQMELYLRWLEKYEKETRENSPIGLILCADKSDEQVELLELNKGNIRVATYLTKLLPPKLLKKKLHEAIFLAKKRVKA